MRFSLRSIVVVAPLAVAFALGIYFLASKTKLREFRRIQRERGHVNVNELHQICELGSLRNLLTSLAASDSSIVFDGDSRLAQVFAQPDGERAALGSIGVSQSTFVVPLPSSYKFIEGAFVNSGLVLRFRETGAPPPDLAPIEILFRWQSQSEPDISQIYSVLEELRSRTEKRSEDKEKTSSADEKKGAVANGDADSQAISGATFTHFTTKC